MMMLCLKLYISFVTCVLTLMKGHGFAIPIRSVEHVPIEILMLT